MGMDKETKRKLLRAFKEHIDMEDDDEGKVLKTFPMSPEQIAAHDQLNQMAKEAEELEAKLKAKRNVFWASIKESLDIWTGHLRINRTNNEIELLDEDDED